MDVSLAREMKSTGWVQVLSSHLHSYLFLLAKDVCYKPFKYRIREQGKDYMANVEKPPVIAYQKHRTNS